MEKENGLILLAEELGVDMTKIYQQACFFPQWLPEYRDIYDAYKIEVMQINMNVTEDTISKQLEFLRSERDFSVMSYTELTDIQLKNDIELMNYLLRSHFSFALKNAVYNSPIKGVW